MATMSYEYLITFTIRKRVTAKWSTKMNSATNIYTFFEGIHNILTALQKYLHENHFTNPNMQISYKILQKTHLQNTAHMVLRNLPYPIYSHGKAYLSKQLLWCAAGNPHLARGRSRVRAAGALFSPPSLPPPWDFFFAPPPPPTWKC